MHTHQPIIKRSAEDIESLFSHLELTEEERVYLKQQSKRLAYAVNLVQEFCMEYGARKVLDVGPHFLTRCIRELVSPQVSVSTLGYEYPKLVPLCLMEEHQPYDLIECARKKPVSFKKAPFDLIVFCEIIEHIPISPNLPLQLLRSLLKDRDGGLLIQTPNAVAIGKRMQMLFGRNPFEIPGTDLQFKEHLREYTMTEVERFGRSLGLSLWKKEYCRYWPHAYRNLVERTVEALIPRFRQGLTVFFKT